MLGKLWALAKMHIKQYNMYPSNYYLFIANRIVEVIVYIFVWQAIYSQTGNSGGMPIDEMVTYYVLVISVVSIVTWGINEDMAHSIRNGQIHKELLTPVSYLQYYFGVYIGEVIFAVIIGIITFIICSIFWQIMPPVSFLNLLLFLLLIILGLPITYFLQAIVGITGFYTDSIWGMQILRKSVIYILSGVIAPISLFPEWFQAVANLLPFKELVYTPIQIYLGQFPIEQLWWVILKQVLWGIGLYFITKLFFKHAVKQVTVNGG